MDQENLPLDFAEKVLTCIGDKYTLCGTPTPEGSEVDIIMITNFLQTLAEISLAVASRGAVSQSKNGVNQ